ncbi:MAG: oxidoreductase [Flavobacteriales bacterium]|nr:oxidoreductase [Flavobacteriales bacterium]
MSKRNWLITGISSGIGKALAEEVMKNGDFVIGTFRKKEQVEVFNATFKNRGVAFQLDVTDRQAAEKMLDAIKREIGNVDVLVNNAGVGFIGAIEESSLEEVSGVFEANFFGALHLTKLVLPQMRAERKGHIVQISSHAGIKAFAGFGVYNASKFALEGMSEALAQEVNPLGIRVSIIQPGPFRTNFANTSLPEAKQVIDDYQDTAGAFRLKLKSVDGKQEGHPGKAATTIFQHVNSASSSLRLPLGKVPFTTINMKLEEVKKDLELNKDIGMICVYED